MNIFLLLASFFCLLLSFIAISFGALSLLYPFFLPVGKRIRILLLVLPFLFAFLGFFLSSHDWTTPTVSVSSAEKRPKGEAFHLEEEITVKCGEKSYTLMITGIREITEQIREYNKNAEQFFLIDYRYRNLSEGNFYLSSNSFQLIDEKNEVGETGFYPHLISPRTATSGMICRAQMVLGVYNRSNTVRLQYFDDNMPSSPAAVFALNIPQ